MNRLPFNILHALLITCWIVTTSGNTKCSSDSPLVVPKYYLMEKCHRSKLGIMAKANYTSLSSCQRLGIEKKALAFNFVPLEAIKEIEWDRKKENHGKDNGTQPLEPIEYTCEVLKCAEVDGGWSLVNDSRYDYYSLYAKPFPHTNATCIPATGMFFLTPHKLNYTQARAACRNMSGVLADVVSEARTEALAQLLAGASAEAALVALRRSNGSAFYGANGMFFLTPYKLNYTQARAACRNMSGVLADVVSEARTEALAQLLAGVSAEAALVALRRSNGSAFYGANGDSLDCSTYRAWAPGHPRRARHKFDCVVVTRQRTWRSTPCKQRYPALCELNPGGPYKRGSIFASLKPINNTEAGAQNED